MERHRPLVNPILFSARIRMKISLYNDLVVISRQFGYWFYVLMFC